MPVLQLLSGYNFVNVITNHKELISNTTIIVAHQFWNPCDRLGYATAKQKSRTNLYTN